MTDLHCNETGFYIDVTTLQIQGQHTKINYIPTDK